MQFTGLVENPGGGLWKTPSQGLKTGEITKSGLENVKTRQKMIKKSIEFVLSSQFGLRIQELGLANLNSWSLIYNSTL